MIEVAGDADNGVNGIFRHAAVRLASKRAIRRKLIRLFADAVPTDRLLPVPLDDSVSRECDDSIA